MNLLDTANLAQFSEATRTYEASLPELNTSIDKVRENARADADVLLRDQLREQVGGDLPKSMTKSDLTDRYVTKVVAESEPAKKLAELQWAARADRRLAELLNEAVQLAESQRKDLVEKLASEDAPRMAVYHLRRLGETFQVTAEQAILASKVIEHVNSGDDLREALKPVVKRALVLVTDYPREIAANGSGAGGFRGEQFYAAQAAREFVRDMATWGYPLTLDLIEAMF